MFKNKVVYTLTIVASLLLAGLVYAHYITYKHIQELIVIHKRYKACLNALKTNDIVLPLDKTDDRSLLQLDKEPSGQNDAYCPLINRTGHYLKESMTRYFKAEKLDHLLTKIDGNTWKEYTEQLSIPQLIISQNPVKNSVMPLQAQTILKETAHTTRNHIFTWPIKLTCFWLSSFFGPRAKKNGSRGFHYGIDMAAVKGTVVRPAAAGIVVEAHHSRGYGNTILIEHINGFKTRYAHLDSICVRKGQKITLETVIGRVGETGYIRKRSRDGSHLHFEVHNKGKRVNPLHYLPSFSL